jgi:O-antigen/teichoic acid export membrane protein
MDSEDWSFNDMTVIRRNVLANCLGRGWSLLMGLAFVPLYIHYMGIEAYGLVGFFAALQATFHLLEFGLSATVNRELARYSVQSERADEARDLARTLEIIYWVVGILVGLFVCLCAPWLSTHWIKTEMLSVETVMRAVAMMGLSIAFQWPVSLYSGGMMGLEQQVVLNGLVALLGTMRGLGAVLALWLIAPTVTVFFAWQILISVVQVGVMAFSFWRLCPMGSRAARVSVPLLRGVWRFTVGMGATGLVTFLLSQLDKIVLSRILSLSQFGCYNIANQVNTASKMSSSAIFTAFLPRMSMLFAEGNERSLRTLFHTGCQCVSFAVLPVSAILAFFSCEILYMWTQSASTALTASPIASLLVVGSALNSMMGIPYDLTVARGWAVFGFYQNLICSVLLVPTMLVLSTKFGGIGAAYAWLALNAGCILIAAPIALRRTLPGELRHWYLEDVGIPLVFSFAIAGFGRWVVPKSEALWVQALTIMTLWLVAQVSCGFALPEIRQRALQIARHGNGKGLKYVSAVARNQ